MRRGLLVACVVSLLVTMAVGCAKSPNDKGVAAVNGTGRPSAGPSLSPLEQAIKWSQCMREHGVQVSDPVLENGEVRPGTMAAQVDKSKVDQADAACRRFSTGTDPQSADMLAQGLRYARCMRANGVPDFPDPDAADAAQLEHSLRSDPHYAAARQACQQDLPKK